MLTINPKEVSVAELHGYLQSAIAPRPIAFASTVDKEGNVNLSPFSFFNVFGTNPPTLIFSPNRRVRDGSQKHTLENVLAHDEVVINMVSFDMVDQMSLASCEYERGVNEFDKAGFTQEASIMVKPPRVKESKASFECKVKQVVQMSEEGGSPNLVICEVVLAHFSEDILDESGKIDQTKTDWVARLGGDWYVRASGDALFKVAKPNLQKGIGVDAIPAFIKEDKSFSGNDLGKLGNIEQLPTYEEIEEFKSQYDQPNYYAMAIDFLSRDLIKEAWLSFLAIK
uniref:flavin reductase family protein n=1 Tax=Algoriphagus sp. TaxID=1872435 RepID=UPI004048BAEB